MKISAKFEQKLQKLLDKYALRPDIIEDNDSDENNDSNDEKSSYETINDDVGIDFDEQDDNDDEWWYKHKNKYYFYYKINIKKKTFDSYYDDDDIDDGALTDKNVDTYVDIMIYDNDIANCIRHIQQCGDTYTGKPLVSLNELYYCINDIRIHYNGEKYNKPTVKLFINFIEDVYKKEFTKMDNMITNGKMDYKSIWYYFDQVDTIYKIQLFEKDVFFKYSYFHYYEASHKKLELYGSICTIHGTKMTEAEYIYNIEEYTGAKELSLFKINKITNDEYNTLLARSSKLVDLLYGIHHKRIDGNVYMPKQGNIVCAYCNERVMIDEEGMEKFSNKAFAYGSTKHVDKDELTDEQKILLFPFVSIFTLGCNKTWGMVHIDSIHDIIYNSDAYNYLVLAEEKKSTIQSLVTCHNTHILHDFIDKKGLGLVFLLYGPPGVGKTLTAEATCEYLHKPMYNVSVCDLGTNPETMESVMEHITEYVRRWNAIILIDEVDIFVEEREYSNVMRNALVSTFLKFLEYNDNIIFLTTNRLENIDRAIKSRINLFINYEKLDKSRRTDIWKSLIAKWKIELKETTIKTMALEDLNGREIRNYMRLIVSILKHRNKDITDENVLKTFKECHSLTKEFESSACKSLYV